MDWFCFCKPTIKAAIQHYSPPPNNHSSKIFNVLASEEIERNASQDTAATGYQEFNNMRLLEQFVLPANKSGTISVKELRDQCSSKTIFRKIQKSSYEEIVGRCRKKGQKWTDPEFEYLVEKDIVRWKRITQILPQATFMSFPIQPLQFLPGIINNSLWLSAVGALGMYQYRLKNLFGSLEISKQGVYLCKLYIDGVYRQILVDDFFPLGEDGKLACSRPSKNNQIWLLVLEKCWAKIFGGYGKADFSSQVQAMWAITGAPVLGDYDTATFRINTIQARRFFQKLNEHQLRNHLITCTVGLEADNQYFLQNDHLYVVIGVFQTTFQEDNIRLIQLCNPLGSTAYRESKFPKLPYNIEDSFWEAISQDEKERLQFKRAQSEVGDVFYVEWSNFLYFFNHVSISLINDNANYLYETVSISNSKPKYFSLSISEQKDFHLIIAQPKNRQKKSDSYANIRILVAASSSRKYGDPKHSYVLSKSYISNTNNNYMELDLSSLTPGTYTIRICANMLQNFIDFTLSYYTLTDFTVKLLQDFDDHNFVSQVLLSRASSIDPQKYQKKMELKEAKGWCCIQNIKQSNICYVAYHIEASSQHQKYTISFDESKNLFPLNGQNCRLYFEGQWMGKNSFIQEIRRGEEVVFPYTYTGWLLDPQFFPNVEDTRKLPTPVLTPQ